MRRLARHLFTLAAAASLLLCVAVCVLWVRSHSQGGYAKAAAVRGDRYTFRAVVGRFELLGPPPAPPSGPGPACARGDELAWRLHQLTGARRRPWTRFVSVLPDGAAVSSRQLLRGLESPDTFVAAHVGLATRGRRSRPTGLGVPEDVEAHIRCAQDLDQAGMLIVDDVQRPGCTAVVDGLRVRLTRGEQVGAYAPPESENHGLYAAAAEVDPAQRAVLRDQWHARLAVPVGSAPPAACAALALLLPASWGTARLVARHTLRRRLRRGLCPSCGYDLRASPGRCPECGAAPPSARVPEA